MNVASVPAGYGLGLRKTMESILTQIANYVPDPTKIPDYFRETQALNNAMNLKPKEMIKNAIEAMAKQDIPLSHNGSIFVFENTKRVPLTPEQKAQGDAYILTMEKYIAAKAVQHDEDISKIVAPGRNSENLKKLKELLEQKAAIVSEIKETAKIELEAKGITAKIKDNVLSIELYTEAALEPEKKVWAEAYILARDKAFSAQSKKIDEELTAIQKENKYFENEDIFKKLQEIFTKKIKTENSFMAATLEELAKNGVSAKIQGKCVALQGTVRIALDDKAKELAESYLTGIKQEANAKTAEIDAEIGKISNTEPFTAPATIGNLYNAIFRKIIAENEIKKLAIEELANMGITAKISGRSMLI